MTHSEMIYKTVYSQCIDIGCDELHARQAAKAAVEDYNRGSHLNSPSKLISEAVASAKKIKQKTVSKSWR